MDVRQKQMLIATLAEMAANLQRSHVNSDTIRTAVRTTAGNLFGNDYDEIVDAVLGRRPAPRGVKIRRGTIVFLTPEDAPNCRLRYVVEADSTGDMLALWNGNIGILASRPVITKEPDGRWANGSGALYTVEVSS
jgi:hypothetical protein